MVISPYQWKKIIALVEFVQRLQTGPGMNFFLLKREFLLHERLPACRHTLLNRSRDSAGMRAQWWELSAPINVAWVPFPDPASYVAWVCCWFSTLLREDFLRVLRFSPLLKNHHFQIPIRSGLLWSTLSWAFGSGDRASTSCVWHFKFT